MSDIKKKIENDIAAHPIILYMKGSKLMPSCGFSSQVVSILNALQVEYTTRNVLEDDELRAAIKEHSNWPTLPQLYINGAFVGGCDVVTQMYESGELLSLISGKGAPSN